MLDKYSGKFSYKIIEKNETTIGVSRKYASENSCIKAICNSKNLFNSEIVIKEENPNAHKKFGKPIIYIERCENEKHTFIIQNSSKTFFLGKYYDNKESCINDINNFKNYDLKYFIIDR